jgi:hypothetical protein
VYNLYLSVRVYSQVRLERGGYVCTWCLKKRPLLLLHRVFLFRSPAEATSHYSTFS